MFSETEDKDEFHQGNHQVRSLQEETRIEPSKIDSCWNWESRHGWPWDRRSRERSKVGRLSIAQVLTVNHRSRRQH
ncbi:hypothetical protein SLEP1_g13647 [Rubroshorea leprosula]|uniref:Uncharacterized protein n=1 Tax=Rubroshorea leprosula TaxID=152421 RepID=A0AAV5IR21_9ROSI|nr:hypothetical protein SLEP1_g13647 [Rubroshorea leprosula]